MSTENSLFISLRRSFIAGVLVVVPLILTYLVLRFLFGIVDGILQPLIVQVAGRPLPGLGIVATLLLVLIVGLLTRNFFGRWVLEIWERLVTNVPIIKPIYSASKQLLEAIAMPAAGSFSDVVMIEYPRPGSHAIGFVTKRIEFLNTETERHHVAVFVPTTPTPMSGFVILTPIHDVLVIRNMTVQDGVNFLVSGGTVSPTQFDLGPFKPAPVAEVAGETR